MNEFRVSVMNGRDFEEVCARILEAGHEVLARFTVFAVLLVSASSASELRGIDGVGSVETLKAQAAA